MRHLVLALYFFIQPSFIFAQKSFADTLYKRLAEAVKEDTNRVATLSDLAVFYGFNQFDSSILYAQRTLVLSKKLDYRFGIFLGLRSLFFAYNCQGNYSKALEVTLENARNVEKTKNTSVAPQSIFYFLGVLNREMSNIPTAIQQLHKSIEVNSKLGASIAQMFPAYAHLALAYLEIKQPDSALLYAQTAFELSLKPSDWERYKCFASAVFGNVQMALKQYDLAKKYFLLGVEQSIEYHNPYFLARNYGNLANLYLKTGYVDSSIFFATKSIEICLSHNFSQFAVDASTILSQAYRSKHNTDSAIKYTQIMLAAKDSVFNQSKVKEFQRLIYDDEQRSQEIEIASENYRNRVKFFTLIAGMALMLVLAFILWRNNRQKQKAQIKIEKAYQDLKATQSQLIHAEKMASLGELTAGIAHEIQNPLNFINNFSSLNSELIEEMNHELVAGNQQEAISISRNILENQEKISTHGNRADGIVKSMLQHTRSSTGLKEAVDINNLTDTYLKLSYNGLRAKDKNFTATIEKEFDPAIDKINIIPQEIGRVFLNIFNNAFYSANEKKKKASDPTNEANEIFQPSVFVRTRKKDNRIEITVEDNGGGISPDVLDKIFQPFFTTKPTGEGTGLGLSLSYDIIKSHGGEITVNNMEGKGVTFKISLPV
jgi:Signal transduction histidine kinase regulating C4-dicarboxylate transport system